MAEQEWYLHNVVNSPWSDDKCGRKWLKRASKRLRLSKISLLLQIRCRLPSFFLKESSFNSLFRIYQSLSLLQLNRRLSSIKLREAMNQWCKWILSWIFWFHAVSAQAGLLSFQMKLRCPRQTLLSRLPAYQVYLKINSKYCIRKTRIARKWMYHELC